jgi:hypothetical protein
MKRSTSFVVVTLFLVLGCGAAFGSHVTLGFLDADGVTQYCDYEDFYVYNNGFAAGIDNLSLCSFGDDGSMIGVSDTFPASNLPVTGPVIVLADTLIDAECQCFTGDQALNITQTKAYNIHSPHFGWEVLFNTYDAFYAYVGSWGYLTTQLGPGPLGATKKGSLPSRASHLSRDRDAMQ